MWANPGAYLRGDGELDLNNSGRTTSSALARRLLYKRHRMRPVVHGLARFRPDLDSRSA